MTREELRAYLEIDKDALDEALMEQPKVYEQVAEATVLADNDYSVQELELEELVAATDKDIRQTAATAGDKITEAGVKAEIATDRAVKAQSRKVLELQKQAKLWKALERSFDQRADMLKKVVDLHLRSTYGYSLENSLNPARNQMVATSAEQNRAAASAVRRKRLEDKA